MQYKLNFPLQIKNKTKHKYPNELFMLFLSQLILITQQRIMTSPLISVAMCTYNAGKYLEGQLFSILEQTYKNIEIVVVDDGSTDGTYDRLQSLVEEFNQIRLYRNDINLGYNKNFEKAIGLCNGEYIAISDQDDIWAPEKLAVLHQHIGNNWLVFSNSELVDNELKPLNIQLLNPSYRIEGRTFKGIILFNSVTGHTSLFSKAFIKHFMPLPATGYYDWWMGFVALYYQRITYINRCLTLHRIHHSSVTGKINYQDKTTSKKKVSSDLAVQLSLFKTYKKLSSKDQKLLERIDNSYQKKISFYLIWLIVFKYKTYLPDMKPRNWLGRFFFALKFTKKYHQ